MPVNLKRLVGVRQGFEIPQTRRASSAIAMIGAEAVAAILEVENQEIAKEKESHVAATPAHFTDLETEIEHGSEAARILGRSEELYRLAVKFNEVFTIDRQSPLQEPTLHSRHLQHFLHLKPRIMDQAQAGPVFTEDFLAALDYQAQQPEE